MSLDFALPRARSVLRRNRWTAVVAAGILTITSLAAQMGADSAAGTRPGAAAPGAAQAAAMPVFQVQLGPEQRLMGPSGSVDSPYFSQVISGKLRGFMGNRGTYRYNPLGNKRLTDARLALKAGGSGRFDSCGAWLQGSIYKNPARSGHWFGWYHAEEPGAGDGGKCVYQKEATRWRVAFAESFDGGKTWKKSSYGARNNVVVEQPSTFTGHIDADAGNPRVIRIGDYFYMFYMASTRAGGPREMQVARAKTTTLGRPGGYWKKYYCTPATVLEPESCDFTEPGRGGKTTPIKNVSTKARFLSKNTYLNRYIGLEATGKYGFKFGVSATPTGVWPKDWAGRTTIYPHVSTPTDPRVDKWAPRSSTSRQLYAYPSILGAKGASDVSGKTFYIYYMKLFPGDDFGERYLLRRKVTLEWASTPMNRVELSTYKNDVGHRRTSTEMPKSRAYRRVDSAGYLLTLQRTGWQQVFECKGRKQDYYLKRTACGDNHTQVRRVGWISPTRTADATVVVYQCYDGKFRSHFASTSRTCAGKKRLSVLGYALPSIV